VYVHLLLLNSFPQNVGTINKVISLLTQMFGGLLILYSIDSNIGVIKQKSLLILLATYFKEFPLIKRPIIIETQCSPIAISGRKAKIILGRDPKSIEEKIEYLQYQIIEIKHDIEQEKKELNDKIDRQSKELSVQIQEAKSGLQNLELKMDEVSTGGVKVQLFGVLLMVYGAISGYAA